MNKTNKWKQNKPLWNLMCQWEIFNFSYHWQRTSIKKKKFKLRGNWLLKFALTRESQRSRHLELSTVSLIITAGHRVCIRRQCSQLFWEWIVFISVAEWRIPFRIYFHLRFRLIATQVERRWWIIESVVLINSRHEESSSSTGVSTWTVILRSTVLCTTRLTINPWCTIAPLRALLINKPGSVNDFRYTHVTRL